MADKLHELTQAEIDAQADVKGLINPSKVILGGGGSIGVLQQGPTYVAMADSLAVSVGTNSTTVGVNDSTSSIPLDATRFGFEAGKNSSGSGQTAVGSKAGTGNITPQQTVVGNLAGNANLGQSQTAVGVESGRDNEGSTQTALGIFSGLNNTGDLQTATGGRAGQNNSGNNQTAVGFTAGSNNSANGQTALGYQAGNINSGEEQTAVGANAGQSNTGVTQTAVGVEAGQSNSGALQTAVGALAGNNNKQASQTAVGYSAGRNNTGQESTQIGKSAGNGNVGFRQTVVGVSAGSSNNGGSQTAVGSSAGSSNSGEGQTAVGREAGRSNSGGYQVTVGYFAGDSNSGDNQIAIGRSSGTGNDADSSISVGSYTNLWSGAGLAFENTVVIGTGTSSAAPLNATKANQVVLGNSSIIETVLRGEVILDSLVTNSLPTTRPVSDTEVWSDGGSLTIGDSAGGGGADLSGKLEWGYPLGLFQGVTPTLPTIAGNTWTHTIEEDLSSPLGMTLPAVGYSALLPQGSYVEFNISLPAGHADFYVMLYNDTPSLNPAFGEISKDCVLVTVSTTGISLRSSISGVVVDVPNTQGVTSFGISASMPSGHPRLHVNGTSYPIEVGNYTANFSITTAYMGQVGEQLSVTLDPVSTVQQDPSYAVYFVTMSELDVLISPAMYGVPQTDIGSTTLSNPSDQATYQVSPQRLNQWADSVGGGGGSPWELVWSGSSAAPPLTVPRTNGLNLIIHTENNHNGTTDNSHFSCYIPPDSIVAKGSMSGFVFYENWSSPSIIYVYYDALGSITFIIDEGNTVFRSVYMQEVVLP